MACFLASHTTINGNALVKTTKLDRRQKGLE